MIRTILALLAAVIFLIIPGLPLLLWMLILSRVNPGLRDRQSAAIIRCVFRVLLFICGTKITCTGRENIPSDRPVLFVCNHRSDFDILVAMVCTTGCLGFVAKTELKKIPLLAQWMKLIRCVFIDRSNPKQALRAINEAIGNVKDGVSMWLFPEGTRSQGEEMLPFKEGSFRIAEKSSCPVVPVAMAGTEDMFEKHKPWIRAAHVKVHFAEPVMMEYLDRAEKKALTEKLYAQIQGMYEELNAA